MKVQEEFQPTKYKEYDIDLQRHGVILDETENHFENEGVFNPAIIREEDGTIRVYYRAVSTGNFSTVGYAELSDPLTVSKRWTKPLYTPQDASERHGVEDPRVAKIDEVYYMTYTAYDGFNALGALATSTDGLNFQRQGFVTPNIDLVHMEMLMHQCQLPIDEKYYWHVELLHKREPVPDKVLVWDKDVVYFPRKIGGKFTVLHRIWPGIQVVQFNKIEELTSKFWEEYFCNFAKYIVLDPHDVYNSHIGAGCVPLETPEGWLMIYHGVEKSKDGHKRVYHAAAALLDLEDPTKVINKLELPLFSPDENYEQIGYVNNVVFPTGLVQEGERLYIYYGASDSKIAVASLSLPKLMKLLAK
jgi:predicted GH43/DUF377 family glycosyl hydrolase